VGSSPSPGPVDPLGYPEIRDPMEAKFSIVKKKIANTRHWDMYMDDKKYTKNAKELPHATRLLDIRHFNVNMARFK